MTCSCWCSLSCSWCSTWSTGPCAYAVDKVLRAWDSQRRGRQLRYFFFNLIFSLSLFLSLFINILPFSLKLSGARVRAYVKGNLVAFKNEFRLLENDIYHSFDCWLLLYPYSHKQRTYLSMLIAYNIYSSLAERGIHPEPEFKPYNYHKNVFCVCAKKEIYSTC